MEPRKTSVLSCCILATYVPLRLESEPKGVSISKQVFVFVYQMYRIPERTLLKPLLRELLWSNSFILVESFDEVALVAEAAGNGYLFDGGIFGGQHLAGTFNTIVVEVIHGNALRHASEIPAEVFGIHSGDFCQIVQSDAA